MGLCQFYRMSPKKSNVLTGPKSADCARKICRMVEIARGMGRQFTIVIFDGESVSPTCLLGKLHSRASLSRMAIHTDREANMGRCNYVYCCPICTYVVKNATALLDHIMVGHYWGSFSCGMCLSFAATNAEEMKRHVGTCAQSQTGRSTGCSLHALSSVVVISLAASPRKQQKEPMKVLARRRGKSRMIHQPPKSRPRSRSPR